MERRPHKLKGALSTELTPREERVVALVAKGEINQSIAQELGIPVMRVAKMVSGILLKRGLDNRVQLTLWWLEQSRVWNREQIQAQIASTEERLQLLRRLEANLAA